MGKCKCKKKLKKCDGKCVKSAKDLVRLPVPPPNKVDKDKSKYTRKKKHKKKEN